MARKQPTQPRRVLMNAGCGSQDVSHLPAYFRKWKQLRVDVDPNVEPDVLASIVDLSAVPDQSVDAVWSAHCVEHLFAHEVPVALGEFHRVVREDGFVCIIVPDLQAIAHWIASDRLCETIYESAAGGVSAHDMIWGFGNALAHGHTAMAHRCGFTPTPLIQCLTAAGFSEILVRRKSSLELVALALRKPSESIGYQEALMTEIGL